MNIKEMFKKNRILRTIVKRVKNYREFMFDAKDFSDNYEEVAEQHRDFRYRLLLYVHNIEKGMSRIEPRPFGEDKVKTIITILKQATKKEFDQYEYKLAIAALKSWLKFFKDKGWEVGEVEKEYINNLKEVELQVGVEILKKDEIKKESFNDVVFTRRSVRDFSESPLKQEDIDYAINCFIAAPTACNRQMCKIYRIKKEEHKQLLAETILGIGGFNLDVTNLFIITYDVSSLEFYGERNQGYLNAGLTAMSFAYGLHSRGIGSCFMQWSNKRSDDIFVRNKLGLPKTERIGIILGAGYYKNETKIPCSTRRDKDSVYTVI